MSQQKPEHYEQVKTHHPEYLKAVEQVGNVVKEEGPINEKNAQLIQLAASIAIRSEGASHSHARRALEAGASKEEIRQTVLLLTNTIGFPNVMAGMTWVNDVMD